MPTGRAPDDEEAEAPEPVDGKSGAADATAIDPPGENADTNEGASDEPVGASATGSADGVPATDDPAQTPDRKRSKGLDEKYCSTCGEIIKQAAEICPECGVRQQGAVSRANEKDPGIAAVISALTGGWGGQLYNGEIGKGIGLLVLQFVNLLLTAVLIGFFTGFVVWIVGIYDAYNAAQKINRGERSP